MLELIYDPQSFFRKAEKFDLATTFFHYFLGIFLMVSLAAAVIYFLKLKSLNTLLYYLSILLFSFMLIGLSLLLSYLIYFLFNKYSSEKAFKVVTYSFYPFYLFGWAIVVGGMFSAVAISLIYTWSTLLSIIGISELFKIKKVEAAVCALLFYQIVVIVGAAIFFI